MALMTDASRKKYLLQQCQRTIDEWKDSALEAQPSSTGYIRSGETLRSYCYGLSNLLAYNINNEWIKRTGADEDWQAAFHRNLTHG